MKRFFRSLLIFLLLITFFCSLLFIDISPYENSYRTSYNGLPTNTIHEKKAQLTNDTENIFWFLQVTDVHIGAYYLTGDNRKNFRDFLENAWEFYNQSYQTFIADTGDLTNAKIPIPYQQDESQWRYRNDTIYASGWWNTSIYFDIPGNHDGYNDSITFSYYLKWSVQKTLLNRWDRIFSYGNYTFIALNSAQNKGSPWPDGTSGDLDQTELDWLEQQLIASQGSNLTFIFGHHPENDIGKNTTTSGKTFLELMEEYKVAAYIYGHGHESHERNQGGTICIETDSLGQPSTVPGYRIFAVDNDGISSKYQPINTWPAVLITCPIDRGLTMQAFDIPSNMEAVPVRALVFDENDILNVEFQIDNGVWRPMNHVPDHQYLWNASFDASTLTETEHTISVRASSSSGNGTDSILFRIGTPDQPEIVNGPLPSFLRTRNCAPWTLNLSMYEWDENDIGIQLNWSVSNVDTSLCLVEITDIINDIVTFTPVSGASGTADINFTLVNSDGKAISQKITITLVYRLDSIEFQLYLGIILIVSIVGVISINILLSRRSLKTRAKSKKRNRLN